MFNSLGNHKIGIFGMANSGKTVFLTSLLWHLGEQEHRPERFYLTDNSRINNFELIEVGDHAFFFLKHQNRLQTNRWPTKSSDYSIARCRYKLRNSRLSGEFHKKYTVNFFRNKVLRQLCERSVSFLTIPAERLFDILILKTKDYQDWVSELYQSWQSDPETERIMKCFCNLAAKPETPLEELEECYKRSMCSMFHAHCPVTPSTFLLGTDGSLLGDPNNADHETAIRERPIWNGGNLLPLPETWKSQHPQEYKKMKKIFLDYRKQVLKPLFKEIKDCDNYIFCVDIPTILNSGPTYGRHTKQTLKAFLEYLAPTLMTRITDCTNRMRLAFVATKSDMVTNCDHLKSLLKDFCGSMKADGIRHQFFTCSACISSGNQIKDGKRVKVGRDLDAPDKNVFEPDAIPFAFPENWNPESFRFQAIAPKLPADDAPPEQDSLDRIYDFIVEGIDHDESLRSKTKKNVKRDSENAPDDDGGLADGIGLGAAMHEQTGSSDAEEQTSASDEAFQLAKMAEADEILKDSFSFPWISKSLRVAILLAASVAMFFIITQTASFLASVRQLSRPEQILLAIPMVIFGGIILLYVLKMLSFFWKLRVSPQIRIKALHELAERSHLRELSGKAHQKAVKELCKLLEDEKTYASGNYADTLRKFSVSEEQILELEKARLKLIDNAKNMPGTTHDWLNDFRERFQKPLDDIAIKQVQKHYLHAALLTGISPYPLIDRLIVLWDSLSMLKELLEIYALKPSWDKNLALLAKVIINVFLAGIIDNAAEYTTSWIADTISKLKEDNGPLSTTGKIAIKFSGKIAAMAVQAIFVRRLGIAAMKMLRPIQDK